MPGSRADKARQGLYALYPGPQSEPGAAGGGTDR